MCRCECRVVVVERDKRERERCGTILYSSKLLQRSGDAEPMLAGRRAFLLLLAVLSSFWLLFLLVLLVLPLVPFFQGLFAVQGKTRRQGSWAGSRCTVDGMGRH